MIPVAVVTGPVVLGLLLQQRSDLLPVYEAIPGAEIMVVRLHAPMPLIEGSLVANHLVDNSQRSPREVATDLLRALGWLD